LQSDWEASSDDEKEKPTPAAAAAAAAPHKKKGSLKQKLAEKEAERQARLALGDGEADYDEDAVLDPRAKAHLEKQRELESDLRNATELFGVKGACTLPSERDIFSFSFLWVAQSSDPPRTVL
jgi:translation initiation factor 3 subunit J